MSYHSDYYHEKRKEYIDLLGGKCVMCGAEQNLHFDHINPNEKLFSIGKLLNHSKSKILNELSKCQLLCEPCHRLKTSLNKDGFNIRVRGEEVSTPILTEDIVKSIRKDRQDGYTLNKLMRKYSLKKPTVYAVISNKTWKHVSQEK